ncbi:selenocysteine lyase/cysteine desulfurase [Streptomyces ambofaciens]
MASAAATAGTAGALPVLSGQAHADTRSLPSLWDVDRSVVNLENAYWGVMPRSVEEEYAKQTRYLNRHNVTFVRDGIPGRERTVAMDQVRAEVAQLMGASKEEFTLTRNGTEAMQNLILQYGSLRPGDAVMYADLDYDEMQQAMDSLTHRRGARVIKFSIPEPATTANILDAYRTQLKKAPAGLKLLLVTHLSNRTGIVMPVREIVSMARARGVDTPCGRHPDDRTPGLHAVGSRRGLRRVLAAQMAVRASGYRCCLDPRIEVGKHRTVHGEHDVSC